MVKDKIFCVNCGKETEFDYLFSYMCKKCINNRDREFKHNTRKEKLMDNEIIHKIKHIFKIDDKIREIENIMKKPCIISINIANENIDLLYGRFNKRRFKVIPLDKDKILAKLKGDYKDIENFCKKARSKGYKANKVNEVEVMLKYKHKNFNFLSDGIYENSNKLGIYFNINSRKVADVKYGEWKGDRSKKKGIERIPDLGPRG